jgi:hypothetical protein
VELKERMLKGGTRRAHNAIAMGVAMDSRGDVSRRRSGLIAQEHGRLEIFVGIQERHIYLISAHVTTLTPGVSSTTFYGTPFLGPGFGYFLRSHTLHYYSGELSNELGIIFTIYTYLYRLRNSEPFHLQSTPRNAHEPHSNSHL